MRRALSSSSLLAICLILGAGRARLGAAGPLPDRLDLEALLATLEPTETRGAKSPGGAKSLGDLLAHARDIRDAVMFVGRTDGVTSRFGTAFVISRQHRLLATNAHVADIMTEAGSLRALRNGSGALYRVDRRWYHPGVRRRTKDRSLIVRSQDPNDGEVAMPCPDVAVLRLSAEGPDLPAEVTLASWPEMQDLFAQAVGTIGFPGYNFTRWPEPGRSVVATVQDGIINRLTDCKLEADGPPEDLQIVQHSIQTWFGFSGSPVFLSNGHVAALIEGTRAPVREHDLVISIPMAIRIDCLWELLAYHKLEGQVAFDAARGRRLAQRHLADDPGADRTRRAVQLVREAERLAWQKSHEEAMARCEEAIRLAPNYLSAYKWAAEARWFRCSDSGQALGVPEQIRLMKEALDSMRKCVAMGKSLDDLVELVGMNNYYSGLCNDKKGYQDSVNTLRKVLDTPNLTRQQRARALQSKAAARWALGDTAAVDDYHKAIEIVADDPFIYEDRATFYEQTRQPDLAEQDRRTARKLRAQKPNGPDP